MKKVVSVTIVLISIFSLSLHSADKKPYGLLTDLIEHTDRVWNNGYLSNLSVWQIDDAIEPFQYAEINSFYPTFSWVVPGEINNTYQESYRILVSDKIESIIDENITGNIWDSGDVASDKSTSVIYGGDPLQPNKVYYWRVRVVTNQDGESEWSDMKAFKTSNNPSEYKSSHYPQVKTLEHPVLINRIDNQSTFIDFGKAAFAQLSFNLRSDGNRSIIIHLGEDIKDGRVNRNPGGTIRYHRYEINLVEGYHTYRVKIAKDKRNTGSAAVLSPDYIGEILPFRYCEIEGYENDITPSEITRESVHYPFNESASFFECSNDTLNQIWDLCKYSIKATSALGIYIDGDRERIPYEADVLINQLSHYGVDKEYSMARRSYEYMLERPTWPTEWIMQAVILAWNDYQYTGDNRSLKSNYDILKARTLMQLRESNGLISTTTGLQSDKFKSSIRFNQNIRDIVDWPHTGILGLNKDEGGEADGFVFTDYNAVTNAYHFETLKLMTMIAKSLDMEDEVKFFEKEKEQFLKIYNNTFFDKKRRLYVDGDTTEHSSLHANMFPVAFGMAPVANENILNFIKRKGMACSVYGSQFLMDALYEANEAEHALAMLTKTDDRGWYNMIRVGSTISLEAWDNKYKPNQDWNHAWGAAPANIIPRKLMGIEPLEAGFGRIRVKPQIASLEWAKAIVPTIRGEVDMEINNNKGQYTMQITIPANVIGEVYLPLLSNKYKLSVNNQKWESKRVKGTPFISLGEIPSGTYDIVMTY